MVCGDRGQEFQDQFKALLSSMGIRHSQSAAHQPQNNDQAEATIKAITHGLQRAVGNDPPSWEEKLPLVLLGLRTAKHASTKYSPYYFITGRHPVLPSARRLAASLDSSEGDTDIKAPPLLPSCSPVQVTPAMTPIQGPSLNQGTVHYLQQCSTTQPILKPNCTKIF